MPDDITGFLQQYNEALDADTQQQLDSLGVNRMVNHGGINANANAGGMYYSNLPELRQLQYDASSYYPAYNKISSTALSAKQGMDETARTMMNRIFSLQAASNTLKSKAGANTSSGTIGGVTANPTTPTTPAPTNPGTVAPSSVKTPQASGPTVGETIANETQKLGTAIGNTPGTAIGPGYMMPYPTPYGMIYYNPVKEKILHSPMGVPYKVPR